MEKRDEYQVIKRRIESFLQDGGLDPAVLLEELSTEKCRDLQYMFLVHHKFSFVVRLYESEVEGGIMANYLLAEVTFGNLPKLGESDALKYLLQWNRQEHTPIKAATYEDGLCILSCRVMAGGVDLHYLMSLLHRMIDLSQGLHKALHQQDTTTDEVPGKLVM